MLTLVCRLRYSPGPISCACSSTNAPALHFHPACRGHCRDEGLVSDSIDESASCMSRLKLRWSEDDLREAYDATEVNIVSSLAQVAHHLKCWCAASQFWY